MRHALFVVAVALLAVSLPIATVATPESKWARGTITAVEADTITITVKGQTMTFAVTSDTDVIRRGGTTLTRKTERAEGRKPMLTEVLKQGEIAEVHYIEDGTTRKATWIRAGISAGEKLSEDGGKRAEGVVKSLSAKSLALQTDAGELTIQLDPKVEVVGEGLGTLSREKKEHGEKMTLADSVHVGDTVVVTYQSEGAVNKAETIRVRKRQGT